jgi:hypothetical protein
MAIDESEREELLRRRLVETVANEVRPRLFGAYLVIGTVVASLLGYVGYNIISGLEATATRTAEQYVGIAIKDKIDPRIAKADDRFDDIDAKQREIERLLDKGQTQIEATDKLIDDLHLRLAAMSEQREKAARELDEAKKLRDETQAGVAASREQLNQLNEDVASFLVQLTGLKSDLQNLRGGSQEYDSLTNALTAISDIQRSIGLLDSRLRIVEAGTTKGEAHSVAVPLSFTEAEKREIEAAMHIHQTALPASQSLPLAAVIKEAPSRNVVEIEYTVTVDDTDTTRRYGGNELIEKVTYKLDKRWFSNPEVISINRADNFRMSLRVWGITSVAITIAVKGLTDSIERTRPMSLSDPVVF